MLLLEPNEGVEIINGHLDLFRTALFALTNIKSLGHINYLKSKFEEMDEQGDKVFQEAWHLRPDSLLTADAVVTYLRARSFFFKERTGFVSLCSELEIEPESIRELLRAEELQALEEGGLDEVNLHTYAPALNEILLNNE